jgi:hypothetical protein
MTSVLDVVTKGSPAPYPIAVGLPRVGRVRIVNVPDRRCLAIEGKGDPGGTEFQEAVSALYATAFSLRFLLRDRGIEAPVKHLEGLWEPAEGARGWQPGDAAAPVGPWRWTLLIPLPAEASDEDVASAMAVARRKRPSPALARVMVMTLREGIAVEAIHVGPYATEPETVERMHEVATSAGLEVRGPHHEVYLGDPRRTEPSRLRTLLRQPLR